MKTTMKRPSSEIYAVIMCMLLFVVGGVKAQERIYSIESFIDKTSAPQMRAMASTGYSDEVDGDKIKVFQDLYYHSRPTLSYDNYGKSDLTGGKSPWVISIHPSAFNMLKSDLTTYDFKVVKLLIIQDQVNSVLPPFLLDTSLFPSLEYVVFQSNGTKVAPLNQTTIKPLVSSANEESRKYLVFIYDNLTEK